MSQPEDKSPSESPGEIPPSGADGRHIDLMRAQAVMVQLQQGDETAALRGLEELLERQRGNYQYPLSLALYTLRQYFQGLPDDQAVSPQIAALVAKATAQALTARKHPSRRRQDRSARRDMRIWLSAEPTAGSLHESLMILARTHCTTRFPPHATSLIRADRGSRSPAAIARRRGWSVTAVRRILRAESDDPTE